MFCPSALSALSNPGFLTDAGAASDALFDQMGTIVPSSVVVGHPNAAAHLCIVCRDYPVLCSPAAIPLIVAPSA